MKRPAASGATELVLSPVAFLGRLAALDLAHDRLTPEQRGELEDALADRTGVD